MLGRSAGDHSIRVTAKMYADNAQTIALTLKGSEEMRTPDLIYEKYYSTHYIWDNKFLREKKQELLPVASLEKPMLIPVHYISYFDYMYFNQEQMPAQISEGIFVLSFNIKSKLNFWKFSTQNDVIYQSTNSTKYVHAPRLILFNSTDFHNTFHFFTGGKLYTKLGFDVYYNNGYKPDSYIPNTGMFYVQNSVSSGKYPKIDLHLTFKVKTVSFFLKYAHANAGYSGPRAFFTALSYASCGLLLWNQLALLRLEFCQKI